MEGDWLPDVDRAASGSRPGLRLHRTHTLPDLRAAGRSLSDGSARTARQVSAVRWIVAAGMLAGLLLSPRLWLSDRLYPQTPIWNALHPIPPPFDRVAFAALLLALIVAALRPRYIAG